MYNKGGSIWAPVDDFIKKSQIQKVVSSLVRVEVVKNAMQATVHLNKPLQPTYSQMQI